MLESTLVRNLPQHLEVARSLEGFVRDNVPTLLKSVDQSWQPADFLPDLSTDGWRDEVDQLRETAAAIPDEVMVVLVGDTITEEALPSYQTWINGLEGVRDPMGTSNSGWAQWSRGWTAEENRHGDLLNRYLYLSGRVNMKAVEITIQNLIRNGFNPGTENDPYMGFIYTSFQEGATKVSHRNVAILAAKAGDTKLRSICGIIAGDEARHETAYKLFMQKIFEADPSGAVQAFARMMKTKIIMPARLMDDGQDPGLFDHFSVLAQKIGVYTTQDYVTILEDLIKYWGVEDLTGLTSEASKAQEFVCTLGPRYRRLAERMKMPETVGRFSWIFNRAV